MRKRGSKAGESAHDPRGVVRLGAHEYVDVTTGARRAVEGQGVRTNDHEIDA